MVCDSLSKRTVHPYLTIAKLYLLPQGYESICAVSCKSNGILVWRSSQREDLAQLSLQPRFSPSPTMF